MDADRMLAMESAAQKLLTTLIRRASTMQETGQFCLVLNFHRGQLNKAAGLRQAEMLSVADPGDGRIVEKAKG